MCFSFTSEYTEVYNIYIPFADKLCNVLICLLPRYFCTYFQLYIYTYKRILFNLRYEYQDEFKGGRSSPQYSYFTNELALQ